jgi:excisionase family DNA binding protein
MKGDVMEVAEMNSKPRPNPDGIIATDFFTRESLSKDLGVSVRTIDRWVSLRLAPPRVVIGKLILFRREAVSEWLRSREDGARDGRKRRRRAA